MHESKEKIERGRRTYENEPSVGGACFVFVSNLGPDREIKTAPIGAVTTILNMQTIKTISAYFRSSSVFSDVSRLNVTGPNAA